MEVSQLSLKRLLYRAGMKRISQDKYEKIYLQLNNTVSNILEKAITLVNKRQNKVLNKDDIEKAVILDNIFEIIDRQVKIGGAGDEWCDGEPTQCQVGGVAYCDGEISQCGNFSEEVSMGCLLNSKQVGGSDYYFSIPKLQFQRLVSSHLEKNNISMTKSGLAHLQYITEVKIVNDISKEKKD